MRKYEVMFVVKPTVEDEATKALVDNMKNVIEKKGAKVYNVQSMGRRELAYEIDTFKNGNYFLFKVEGEPEAVKEFDRVANINEDIIRHIVVKREK